jgi:glycyl-tRNA synthetase beta chain
MITDTLLVEIATEELPPKSLKALRDSFANTILSELVEAGLCDASQTAQAYASPRRLAVSIQNVASEQEDQQIERRGPAVAAAFKDGEATQAALGFAKSCGTEVDKLDRIKTDKGEWLAYQVTEQGKPLSELISGILETTVKRLPIAKRMRWGDGDAEFVRPVHRLIVMLGDQVIPCSVLSIDASNTTYGHRFHCAEELTISHADQYEQTLYDQGKVIANFEKRQQIIKQQITELASSVSGQIEDNPALLDEVTSLVEWPAALLGSFDQDFLKVPQECLIYSMRDHQKYFHLIDENGKLLAHFITVSNIESRNPKQVTAGNERVLRSRLSDARFFWETDLETSLADFTPRLEKVLFHVKLGSVADKAQRLMAFSEQAASLFSADSALAKRGAELAKADLVSDMVGEFDELQGVMGRYYANHDKEPEVVAQTVEQHYWPRFAGDTLPETAEAQAVSVADKLDSLVGIFSANEIPTGDKDPYGLRRASLGVLRILIEKSLDINIAELIELSASTYAAQGIEVDGETKAQIVEYMLGRLPAYYQGQDVATQVINSVAACKPSSPLDFDQRLKAINTFNTLDEAQDLSAANKRISNILRKQTSFEATSPNPELMSEDAEIALFDALSKRQAECDSLFDTGEYSQGLALLAELRSPIDAFFDSVMVMSDDPAVQRNRLNLLSAIQQLFLRVADISLLQN